MSASNLNSGKKPKCIIEIEQTYGVVLTIGEFADPDSDFLQDNEYALNSQGDVIAISFGEVELKSLELVGQIKSLSFLQATNNLIEDLSPLFPNDNLSVLYVGGNRIKDLKPIIGSKLKKLVIWENPIEDFAPISRLSLLEEFYCQDTGFSDLSIIAKLKNIKHLGLYKNKIADIELVYSLLEDPNANLSIELNQNEISYVPKKIAERYGWSLNSTSDFEDLGITPKHYILLEANPLKFPPIAVLELGPDTVKDYYDTAEDFGYAPLSEGRIIVVGDGSAGKSSLIERVLFDTFEQGKNQTNGIKIENMSLVHEDGRDLTFHIWDFGGQEIQHAVHKFFFTEGCLYILVLDNRKEEEPEYWLQQIESLGGGAHVMVVFNKQDDNLTEIADRKFLKEKYPNIVGFYNTSCKTGYGISDLKKELQKEVVLLNTVDEQFPNNWFAIKKSIEAKTTWFQHYLDYDDYTAICRDNNVSNEKTQKLLLKYFTTVGSITWFGDTYLNFLHVLSPAWITQGVYKIITAKTTSQRYGVIDISDFKDLLQPNNSNDYQYDENHYGYILSMMKKFDLCYTPDDKQILIPSAFGKVPKLEYSDFRGENVRVYILQFKDYMPLALIHRFTAKKLPYAYENNYWYSGIVIEDAVSDTLAMVQADREAKRIYVRIKGDSKLGMWEHIRREFEEITSSYAKIPYSELVALDDRSESTVDYQDLISHIQSGKYVYFHPKIKKDFNVGYLIGLFESKENTLGKFRSGEILMPEDRQTKSNKILPLVVNILNNNSSTVSSHVNTQISIDIDVDVVNSVASNIKGDANYLIETLDKSNVKLIEALEKVKQFADDAKSASNSGDVKERGWGRKLKNILQVIGTAGKELKNIGDGGEALKSIIHGIKDLAHQFNLNDIIEAVKHFI